MTEVVFELDGIPVPVDVVGPGRKARLTVEGDGSLRLRAASDVATDELSGFLESKRGWVHRKLSEKEAFDLEPVVKELVDGEGFTYLGRNYRLKLADVNEVRLEGGRLRLPIAGDVDGPAALVHWYSTRGIEWAKPRARALAERLRVDPTSLTIADLAHKWGSTSPGGRVRLHWATFQLRPALIDYVVAHELAHLREPHHGLAFWQLLGRVMPDCADRKDELARTGGRLWMGATRR